MTKATKGLVLSAEIRMISNAIEAMMMNMAMLNRGFQ
jgi:hypothetical protein